MAIHVEAISNDRLCFSYECGMAMSLIVNTAVEFFRSKIPQGIEVNTNKRLVSVLPDKIDELKNALEYVSISQVCFHEEYLETRWMN